MIPNNKKNLMLLICVLISLELINIKKRNRMFDLLQVSTSSLRSNNEKIKSYFRNGLKN